MSTGVSTHDAALGVRTRRTVMSLREAWREFWRWPSPKVIATAMTGSLVANVIVAGWSLGDLWVVVGLVAAWPFIEWVTHVMLLHMRPKRWGRLRLDPLFARKHREHHADPTDTELIFIPIRVELTLFAIFLALALFAFPRLSLGLTFLLAISTIGLCYEWLHFLVHSDYRPKSAPYRALWRHHRLHHYKNEKYWFGLTTTGPDHLFGTAPDPREVERSPTARDLLGAAPDPG
jgi:sterol desaturase/sphingolipid hydroxylase (fatty acid hydroxylase superfamily)